MGCLPALELWDLIVSVFGNISHVSDQTGQLVNGKNKSYNKIDIMQDIDYVPSNVQSASREVLLTNADWDCFKTLTSREILKIQNPLLQEHCAFLEVIHLFQ